MMNLKKYKGISAIGFLTALIIVVGVVMVLSAPFMVNNRSEKVKDNNTDKSKSLPDLNFETEINNKLSAIDTRINAIENKFSKQHSNRYVCSIEGKVDDNGNIVPVDNISGSNKFVFVCEYKY